MSVIYRQIRLFYFYLITYFQRLVFVVIAALENTSSVNMSTIYLSITVHDMQPGNRREDRRTVFAANERRRTVLFFGFRTLKNKK